MTINYAAWLFQARLRLSAHETPRLEAEVLLGAVTGKERSAILAHPEYLLTEIELNQLDTGLSRLAEGVPLPYVLGWWEFYGRRFTINADVLIPRPETELLVELAINWLNQNPGRRRAADVGTGSGCIAITLALQTVDLRVTAVDYSLSAMRVAKINRDFWKASSVALAASDLLSAAAGPFDLVTANLPYIPSKKLVNLKVARQEPLLALDGGADGLELINGLLADAQRWLAPGGLILLEIEAEHARSAPQAASRWLPEARIDMIRDLAGLPRVVRIQAR
jgi:release factor glutamine methyltransferase